MKISEICKLTLDLKKVLFSTWMMKMNQVLYLGLIQRFDQILILNFNLHQEFCTLFDFFFEISKLLVKVCKLHVLFDVDCSIAFFVHNFNKVIDIIFG